VKWRHNIPPPGHIPHPPCDGSDAVSPADDFADAGRHLFAGQAGFAPAADILEAVAGFLPPAFFNVGGDSAVELQGQPVHQVRQLFLRQVGRFDYDLFEG